MPQFDTVIKQGTVIDGLRTPRFRADVGIKDGRIASIGSISASDGEKILDASGLIVAPGFVDLHTHYDSQVYWDPWCTISGWHGVTSCAIGNCGFGFAPVRPEDQDRAMLTMARNEAVPLESMQAGMPWDWETYPEFLDSLERTPKGVNLLSYIGLNPLMTYVMGLEAAKSRPATEAERAEMQRLLEEGMLAGGCGFSAQLGGEDSIQRDYDGTPMVTDRMAEDDLVSFADVLRKLSRGFIQIFQSSPELTQKLAATSGRPIVWNLITLSTDQHGVTMPNYRDNLEWIEEANVSGQRIFAQAVTVDLSNEFTLEDWNLYDTSPSWRDVTLGAPAERAEKMADPTRRQAIKEEFDSGSASGGASTIPSLLVTEVANEELKHLEGMSVGEIAESESKHPIDAMLDVALADELKATFASRPQSPETEAMKELANAPFSLPGVSDGGAHTKFITLGAYPTEFLSLWVRDREIMDLEQAHWRLSAYPAMAAGFKDRGWLREGSPADILVYDYDNLKMLPVEKAWDFPAGAWRRIRKADGYRWTIVNGEVTFENGECTGATPGKLLRHGITT